MYADGSMCIFDGLGAMKHKQPALPAGPVLCIDSRLHSLIAARIVVGMLFYRVGSI